MEQKQNFGLQEVFFFLILIALSIAFFNIIEPFLTDIFLTLILVILFQRPHRFFLRKFKGKTHLASYFTLMLVSFVIVIPLFFIGYLVTAEATDSFHLLQDKWPEIQAQITPEKYHEYLADKPVLRDYLADIDINDYKEKAGQLLSTASRYAVSIIQGTFTSLAMMLVHAFIILFLMFYMLVDGNQLLERVQYLLPLKDDDERELFSNVKRVTDAIVINSFMLGAIEGIYGATLLAIFGVPSPVFWGFIMAIFSVIPILGANTVMFPIALVHLIIGDYTTGILLIILGNGAFLIDQNVIRPRLDGNKSGMHTAFVFLASLGGLFWMGIIGFLAGPLLTALFIAVWNQYGIRYQKNLEVLNKGSEPEDVDNNVNISN